jgi:hypothetical protein
MRQEILKLQKQNAALTADNQKLVAENARLVNPQFVLNDAVLWKRTPSGYETHPYCAECPRPAVMSPMHHAHLFVCSSGHQASLSSKPPSV